MAIKGRTQDKWKKKRWYKIMGPKVLDQKEISETPAEKPEQLVGRTVKISARELSSSPKKSFIDLWVRITNVQGLSAHTVLDGMEIKPATMKRIVRRKTSKADVILDARTKDGATARIKATIVTYRKVERGKKTDLRMLAQKEMEKIASERDYEDLVADVVFGSVLGQVAHAIKKVTNVKKVEVMKIERHDK